MGVLEARDLVKTYGEGAARVSAVSGVSFGVERGEMVLIMGPSGSGKTTLLSMLGGLLRPTSGRVLVEGEDLTALGPPALADVRAHRIGFVFQAFNLLPELTLEDNVAFPAGLVRRGRREARARARELIERLGLSARRRAYPRDLSGGEQQRAAIARALVNDPPLILADEPTGNLDSRSGQEVMMLLREIVREQSRAALVVSHDLRLEEIVDRILWLEDGKLQRHAAHHRWERDPVCGMRVDALAAPAALDAPEGRVVFCSTRCRDRYLRGERDTLAPRSPMEGGR